MTPQERRRGALEHYLVYYLTNMFDARGIAQFFVYHLSDTDLEKLIEQVGATCSTIPPIIPNSPLDNEKNATVKGLDFVYVNREDTG